MEMGPYICHMFKGDLYMSKFNVKNFAIIALAVLAISIAAVQVPTVHSELQNVTDGSANAVAFLKDVMGIDTARYSITLKSTGAVADYKLENYILNSTDDAVSVVCLVKDNIIRSCSILSLSANPPAYTQNDVATKDQAINALDRYTSYSNASYLQSMRDTINTRGISESAKAQIGEARLEVTNSDTESRQSITWARAPEGINNTYNAVALDFSNGRLVKFTDFWDRQPIGSFDVNIDQTKAIEIAKNAAQNYSITYNNATISGFILAKAENAILTELTMQTRNNALNPAWGISLGLDKESPAGITELQVAIWADTGEVAGVNWASHYGTPSNAAAPIGSPQPANNASTPTNALIIALAAAIIVAASVCIMAVQKRKK
jgi:hypothetical protein